MSVIWPYAFQSSSLEIVEVMGGQQVHEVERVVVPAVRLGHLRARGAFGAITATARAEAASSRPTGERFGTAAPV